MSLSGDALIEEIVARRWRPPILRLLAGAPLRYGEIRTGLRRLEGYAPGDGTISFELKSLAELGLIERQPVEGTTRQAWALTDPGKSALHHVNNIEKIVEGAQAGKPLTVSSGTDADKSWLKGLKMDETQARELSIDTTTPHPARRYNYLLGGKDNFAADRESGDLLEKIFPSVRVSALENRRFLQRGVGFLASECGIDQFLDIGTGLPTADNTHEVAQRINPRTRVVYVDNDPLVLAHARALLTSTPEGRTDYIDADLRDPAAILQSATDTLNFDRPIAVMLVAVLHFIESNSDARDVVCHLVESLAPGSYLAVSHMTIDNVSEQEADAYHQILAQGKHDAFARTHAEFVEFFDGLELVDPGVVVISDWRSTVAPEDRPTAQQVASYGAIARKSH